MLLRLPAELLYDILSYLVPPTSYLAFTNTHDVTKQLLHLALVCKTLSVIANDLLLRHCVYIPSAKALSCISHGLLAKDGLFARLKHGMVDQPSQAIVCVYQIKTHLPDEAHVVRNTRNRQYTHWSPRVFDLHASTFGTFFSHVGHRLTRLVLNTPPHSNVRRAFRHLTALEEFCCVRIDKHFCPQTPDAGAPAWACCQKLRRLALTHVNVTSRAFLEALQSLKHLTHLFLVCPSSLDVSIPQGSCSGPRTMERLMIIPLHTVRFCQPLFIRDWVAPDTFLVQMHASRRTQSADVSMKTTVLPLRDSVNPFPYPCHQHGYGHYTDLVACEEWLVDTAQHGNIWNLDPDDHCDRKVELWT